ncbi:MAG: hypothetical protein US50_C0019G0009 [Candidatus Nomurabacteria bacterium GW2011_GWB1_37_5]|uniref:Uncharacterized protein n=1 Tax=Candidatus Nomurabacteria bacterium GW2011_GWB1_37_5 TaxID=1618742 RepID=A0A0G0GZ56_9BACT|nr:MAG: hypothetical protein US50_C0019G0009 [Candidatus Nomurabacteria bacterium GW2011_GWB1_37_5]
MLSKNRVKKIEENIAQMDEQEKSTKYKYVFSTQEDYEEAKKQGLIDPKGYMPALILDI